MRKMREAKSKRMISDKGKTEVKRERKKEKRN